MGTDIAGTLSGKRVAVTGRLACLSHSQFIELVHTHGGTAVDRVAPETSLLVIGAGGWPMQANGRLTKAMESARRLRRSGSAIETVSESEFLRRLDSSEQASVVRQHTLAELSEMLNVPVPRLHSWLSMGLIRPSEVRADIAWFDFAEVTRCRALCELSAAGVSGRRLYRSIRMLQGFVSGTDRLLDRLQVNDGRLILRHSDGRPAEPHGQLLMEFEEEPPTTCSSQKSGDLFERAVVCEDRGELVEAARLYRELIDSEGPDADVLFNLANCLAESSPTEAIAAYEQAVRFDPQFCEAWTNLGSLQIRQGHRAEAIRAFHQALEINPTSPEALYGMALTMDQCGMADAANRHWRAFLYHEPEGERSDYARSRLQRG